ncbi:pseudaminic acid cytidylyltransferase [Nonlabens sp. SY33080]|uniref:pseudaminic acid cytidylyltransferase n=1 Tax=Nonlabens sp. SY33080 TaxID=2719911 RepID=UPI001428D631|nr:pseudaminic acid cytidylyltransferase [Nonlabens sp. SY33080]
MSKLCIIPARGGSKRIPRKNIKSFLGKPIIAYSIDAALNSKLFDEVMVSTDDEEIAEIAMKYGATVPFYRSEENSNDHATTFDVLKEVIEEYKLRYKKEFKYACCIYPTAPFVTSKRLSEALDTLVKNDFDTVFPIIKFGFPIQRALKLSESGKIEFFNKEHQNTRSQDLEPTFHDAGQYYWFNVIRCLEAKTLITQNCGSVIIKETEGQDIDNEIDWKLAEIKYELL